MSVTEALTGANVARLPRNAALGELLEPLAPGTVFGWDEANSLHLKLYSGHLAALDDAVVLAGGNRLAVETDAGDWEIIGFAAADLLGPGEYRLSRLLRGQGGTDWAMGPCGVGRRVVILDDRPQAVPVPGAGWVRRWTCALSPDQPMSSGPTFSRSRSRSGAAAGAGAPAGPAVRGRQ